MQIQCPNCGEKITATNINIQDKIAVCGACDTVFKFELPEEKIKRRKIKQPQNLILRDDDTLKMRFRTNFRLDQDEGFISSAIFGAISAVVGSALFAGFMVSGKVALVFPLAFFVVTAFFVYLMAVFAYNHTELEMDDELIRLSRKPL